MNTYIRKPFKGLIAYEWQIGRLVLQWVHQTPHGYRNWWWGWTPNQYDGSRRMNIWRLQVWTDPYWRRNSPVWGKDF